MDPDERKKIVDPDSSNFIDYHKIIILIWLTTLLLISNDLNLKTILSSYV